MYNTNNEPVPSNDMRVLSNNAKILDNVINSTEAVTLNRLGEEIITLAGMSGEAGGILYGAIEAADRAKTEADRATAAADSVDASVFEHRLEVVELVTKPATTKRVGVVMLSNAIDSDKEDIAATSRAVKALVELMDVMVPVGIPLPWPQSTPPKGWLRCDGTPFDKSIYPELAKAYPSGVLPDLRGEFIRGLDAGRGIDPLRTALSSQLDEFKNHTHTHENNSRGVSAVPNIGAQVNNATRVVETGSTGGSETRPRNVAFLLIVRAA